MKLIQNPKLPCRVVRLLDVRDTDHNFVSCCPSVNERRIADSRRKWGSIIVFISKTLNGRDGWVLLSRWCSRQKIYNLLQEFA